MMNKQSIPFLVLMLLGGLLHAEDKYKDRFENAISDGGSVRSILEWRNSSKFLNLSVEEDPTGINSGKAMKVGQGRVLAPFSPIVLQENESIKLTLQFRFTSQPPDTFNAFRIGLFNDTSGTPADGFSKGYWFMTNPGTSQANGMIFFEQGIDGSLGGGTDVTLVGKWFASEDYQTKPHKLTLIVTRLPGESGVEITCQSDEGASSIRTQIQDPITTFNGICINIVDPKDVCFVLIDDVTISIEPAN